MHPSEPERREPREVTISRDQAAPLRDRQRGVLGVGDQLVGGPCRQAKPGYLRKMSSPRRREATVRMVGQMLDRGDGHRQGRRVGVDPRAGHDPQEPHGHKHAEGERLRAIDRPAQPVRVLLMPRLVLPVGVDEDADVRHGHRQRSPSRSWSSVAAARTAGSWRTRGSDRPNVTIEKGRPRQGVPGGPRGGPRSRHCSASGRARRPGVPHGGPGRRRGSAWCAYRRSYVCVDGSQPRGGRRTAWTGGALEAARPCGDFSQ